MKQKVNFKFYFSNGFSTLICINIYKLVLYNNKSFVFEVSFNIGNKKKQF